MATVGAVLSGGASHRMGRPKAVLPVAGTPMARLVADALGAGGCAEVVLVGGDAVELAPVGRPVVADLHPGAGPLGGVLSALYHFDAADDVVVAACDLPALDAAAVAALIDAAAANRSADVVVGHTGRREPAFALWRAASRDAIDAMFGAGVRALHAAMNELVTIDVTVVPAALVNVNRPDDVPSE